MVGVARVGEPVRLTVTGLVPLTVPPSSAEVELMLAVAPNESLAINTADGMTTVPPVLFVRILSVLASTW